MVDATPSTQLDDVEAFFADFAKAATAAAATDGVEIATLMAISVGDSVRDGGPMAMLKFSGLSRPRLNEVIRRMLIDTRLSKDAAKILFYELLEDVYAHECVQVRKPRTDTYQ